MKEQRIRAWHFLPENGKLRYGRWPNPVRAGVVYVHKGPVEMCIAGMHASVRAIDALGYAPGPIICLVDVWGEVQTQPDKIVGRRRKVLAMADATRALHEFALWCAERALALMSKPDPRSLRALDVKRSWLDGGATDEELVAARAAAWAADRDAARAAARDAARAAARAAAWAADRAAAWAADRAAARDAAWAADRAAAWAAARAAARDAAWDAARDAQNVELERRLTNLLGVGHE